MCDVILPLPSSHRSQGNLPDAKPPFGDGSADAPSHVRKVFHRMGFDDVEIVALCGAHTLGRAFAERSGVTERSQSQGGGTAYTNADACARADGTKVHAQPREGASRGGGVQSRASLTTASLMRPPPPPRCRRAWACRAASRGVRAGSASTTSTSSTWSAGHSQACYGCRPTRQCMMTPGSGRTMS
eukprot:4883552-Prymnesium_polylepis.1